MAERTSRRQIKPHFTEEEKKELQKLTLDYKDPKTLRRFITESGNILSRAKTGMSAKAQRVLAKQIKRARYLALLPFEDHI